MKAVEAFGLGTITLLTCSKLLLIQKCVCRSIQVQLKSQVTQIPVSPCHQFALIPSLSTNTHSESRLLVGVCRVRSKVWTGVWPRLDRMGGGGGVLVAPGRSHCGIPATAPSTESGFPLLASVRSLTGILCVWPVVVFR